MKSGVCHSVQAETHMAEPQQQQQEDPRKAPWWRSSICDVCTFKWFFSGFLYQLLRNILWYSIQCTPSAREWCGDADIIIYNCEYGFNWSCAAQKNDFTSGFMLRYIKWTFFGNEKWFLKSNCGPLFWKGVAFGCNLFRL